MSLADRMVATSLRLLTMYGEYVTVDREASDVYDPVTGVTTTTNTQYNGVGYPSNYRAMDIANTTILQSDTLLIFASATLPLVNDIFTVRGKALTALDVQRISISGMDVVYKIQLRQ